MTKKINKDLTSEQKLVLFEDGTEAPGTSELNYEKRKGSYHCANCGEKLFDSTAKYERVQVGLHFISLYLMYLKLKLIIYLVTQEQSIIVKNVEGIMDTYLKMVQNQQVKDIVIMEFV